MWRYYYTIVRNIYRLPKEIKTMQNMIKLSKINIDKCNEETKYRYVQKNIIDTMKRTAHIKTEVFGEENLPKTRGYMMYPNHQGKYVVYGIISVHKQPCTFVMDIEKSNTIFIKQLVDLLNAKRLDKKNNRQAMIIINEVAKEVSDGKNSFYFQKEFMIIKRKIVYLSLSLDVLKYV